MKSKAKKIRLSLASETVKFRETATPFGGILRVTASVPSTKSSQRHGAKPVAYDHRKVNLSIRFELGETFGSISLGRIDGVTIGAVPVTLSDKTRRLIEKTGASPENFFEIEAALAQLADDVQAAAKIANASVGVDADEWFD